ncbi:Translocation protein S62 [Toensbergia leucococca]|nr:Translocation protein S62 [Toensbergia leucococca]
MVTGPPAPGTQPNPEQMAAMQKQMALEASKRGMTPQQFQQWQRQQIEADAKKAGLTFDQYVNQLKQQAFQNHQRQQQQQQQAQQQQAQQPPQQQQGQQVPINPGAPDPKAVAIAKWLRSQDLKPRTCILNGQRKDMFRVKRAIRALQSPAYALASSKPRSLLPQITTPANAAETFKLLPLSLLALRVSKVDPSQAHSHGGAPQPPPKPTKRTKGLWTVRIEQQQDVTPDLHYVWLYEGPQWRTKLYAVGALIAIMALVMFPLWPIKVRIGVWYLSMGALGLLGLFFAMAIFRLILFCATVFTVPPGLWLYPNLFEDVGFFDSFRPVWGWQEEKKKKKSSKPTTPSTSSTTTPSAPTTSKPTTDSGVRRRDLTPRVEEVEDD